MKRAAALLLALALAGCGSSEPGEDAEVAATDIPKSLAARDGAASAVESDFGTPVKDRVATVGLLNKRNNLIQDIVLKTGESKRVGNVIVKLATCERTLPWEKPEEEGAFVQVFVEDPAGGLTQVHSERLYVGDTPVEYLGPVVESHWRGRVLRLRITDVATGETLADDLDKVRRT